AYFLSSEVSFSLGISGWLYVLCMAPLVARGVDMSSSTFEGGLPIYTYFGAYLGMGVMVIYLGRRFYWGVLKRALFLPDSSGEVNPAETWATRVGILACAGAVVLLSVVGLHPVLAAGFVLLAGLIFMMVGRVHVATGLFIIQQLWHPADIAVGSMGALALGPHALVIVAILCIVVTNDTRIALVPLALNAFRMGDSHKLAPGQLARWMALAVVVTMILAVCVAVWMQYNYGLSGLNSANNQWAQTVAKMPLELLSRNIDRLTEAQLAVASEPVTIGRMLGGRPARHFFAATGVGLLLVIGCSALRLRFARWPLHPVMFLVWGQPWMIVYAPSFLLAWLIKGLILKYGGQKAYRDGRKFFVGLVMGEIVAATLWMVITALYYARTGHMAEEYLVRP
ncbi:hypothetical protein LCGC14_2127070, partial [marine sediment metagenome]